MSRLDELPADQKAVLQLLLKQGKSYDELATLLRLEPAAVRERALDALDGLGPEPPAGLTSEQQDEIADYLLSQQSASQRQSTREFLEGSAGGRAWARSVAGELKPLAGDALPDIPAERQEVEEAFDALGARQEARERQAQSSKLGGILLLVGLAAALAFGIVLLVGGDDDDEGDGNQAAQTQTAATGATGQQGFLAQINLQPANRESKALGAAFIVEGENGKPGLQVAAQDVPESNRYVVWLRKPGKDLFRGFARYVGQKRIIGVDPDLPADWDTYDQLLVTREKVNKPTRPTTIVLSGTIEPPSAAAQQGATGAEGGAPAPAPTTTSP